MAVDLPNVQQPFVEPDTGLVNRTWYLALLNLNNQVQPNVVTSVNISGNNGIVASGGPITSSGVFSLFIGNLTCTNVLTSGTLTAANAVIVGAASAANASVSGTVTAANVRAVGLIATGTVTSLNAVVTGSVSAANVAVSGRITSVNVAVSGDLRVGNAFVVGAVVATGSIVLMDSTGVTYRMLCAP